MLAHTWNLLCQKLKQKTSFQVLKQIYSEGGFGLNGLNRGLTSTLGRHGIWNMVYFGVYHNIKVFISKTDVIIFFFQVILTKSNKNS